MAVTLKLNKVKASQLLIRLNNTVYRKCIMALKRGIQKSVNLRILSALLNVSQTFQIRIILPAWTYMYVTTPDFQQYLSKLYHPLISNVHR